MPCANTDSAHSYVLDIGAVDGNDPGADPGADILIKDIQDTRDMLSSMNLGKTLPVGTADAGSYFSNKVLEEVDYGVRFSFSYTPPSVPLVIKDQLVIYSQSMTGPSLYSVELSIFMVAANPPNPPITQITISLIGC